MADETRIREALSGLDFPATKSEIVQHVRSKEELAPEEMTFFDQIPDVRYEDPTELTEMATTEGDTFGERLGDAGTITDSDLGAGGASEFRSLEDEDEQ